MKLLIRFEDTYGMADIFCASRKTAYTNPKETNTLLEISDQLFIENGKKDKILSDDYIRSVIKDGRERFEKIGYNIEFRFLPVVYDAETIMLYQYISDAVFDAEPERLVHNVDTNLFHLILLSILSSTSNYKKAKLFRNFIDINILSENIRRQLRIRRDRINRHLLNWVLNQCSEYSEFLSIDETLSLLEEAGGMFERYRSNSKTIRLQGQIIDTHISIRRLKEILNKNSYYCTIP